MGCGSVKQFPIYQKDEYPECINLTFSIPESEIPQDVRRFDDNDMLANTKVFQISALSISVGDYIVGV